MKRLALALAFLTALLGLWFGTSAASGADAYGYVSQADLWLRGTLVIDEPLADEAPWRNANWALTPFGYRPGDQRGTMVPTYSPGLPIVMAAFKAVGGPDAVFYVVPLLGALIIWLTFLLAARLGGPLAGLAAAVTLLASPAFLFQLMWPMSDVPATAWWLLSVVLAVKGTRTSTAIAGLAAALATLTRPNLAPLALPILAYVIGRAPDRRQRLVQGALFTSAMLPGPIAVAVINQHLYQSAFASGYGTFSTIYQGAHLGPNLVNYFQWLLQTQTPYVLLALLAPFVLRRRADSEARAIAALLLAVSTTVLLSYLWYTPFDSWTYLRFLLPAFPLLLALAATVLVTISPAGLSRRLTVATVVTIVAAWGAWTGRTAFQVRTDEARYVAAGRLATGLPPSAVIVSNQHSGSLRHYADRVTLRFEWLDPDMYVPALEHFQRLNRPVYAVLDDWERDVFRARYAQVTDLSWLNGPPLVVAAERVYFYVIPLPGSTKTLGYNEKTP